MLQAAYDGLIYDDDLVDHPIMYVRQLILEALKEQPDAYFYCPSVLQGNITAARVEDHIEALRSLPVDNRVASINAKRVAHRIDLMSRNQDCHVSISIRENLPAVLDLVLEVMEPCAKVSAV
jgi:hypothetical protein